MTLNTILFYPIFFFFNQLEIMIFFYFRLDTYLKRMKCRVRLTIAMRRYGIYEKIAVKHCLNDFPKNRENRKTSACYGRSLEP